MEAYLLCLLKQYNDSIGSSEINLTDLVSKDFIDWVENNNNLVDEYGTYLKELGFEYEKYNTMEVGKGIYDTISDLSMVSNFADTLGLTNSELLINDGNPLVLIDDTIIIPNSISNIITHNPYFNESIKDWYQIHNRGIKNISIGVYGNIYDKDKDTKMVLMKDLSNKMIDDYRIDYDTVGDNYMCTLNSKRNVKEKRLSI